MVAVMATGHMECNCTTTTSSVLKYSYNDARVITDEGYCTPLPKCEYRSSYYVVREEPKKDPKKYSFRLNQLLYNLHQLPFRIPKRKITYRAMRLPKNSSLVRPKQQRWTAILSRKH